MKKKLFLLAVLAGIQFSYAQTSVSGKVYIDANKNNIADKNERGVANVSVSNGTDVVLTDRNGYYSIPCSNDDIIFVIKPADYAVPLNENHQPQFYYINKPLGSPKNFEYAGVAATTKISGPLNFKLIPEKENPRFTVLIFGDPQPSTKKELSYFSKGVVTEVKGIRDIAFGLSLGDLVGNDLSLHPPYIKVMNEIGVPWYNVMGNHDMNYEAVTDSLSDETFEKNFGPNNYAFNYGNVHFIILDDILYPDPRDGKGHQGGFRKDQLDFVQNDLQFVPKDKLIVLAFHIPLLIQNESFRKEDRDRLFDILKDFPNTLTLSAHTHLQRHNFYTKVDGWLQEKPHHEFNAGTTSGDWYSGEINEQGVPVGTMRDGTPKGYIFARFDNNRYTIDYKVANKSADYQMRIYLPEIIAPKRFNSAGIYVNVFNGYKTDEVEYRVDNDSWQKMDWIEEPDPDFVATLVKWDKTNVLLGPRRPSQPEACAHLWQAKFPARLKPGEHSVEIKATNMFGKTYTATEKFTVANYAE